MDLNLHADNGSSSGAVPVSDAVFGKDYNEALVHQVVTAFMAASRSGTKSQKNRSAVRGGGAKPWRQKGTGRARAGTNRSPLWRGGGATFAANPRNYAQKVNRKMYGGAVRSILSELVRQDRLKVVESFSVDQPKTKMLLGKLSGFGISDVLIVSDAPDENLYLAARNLYGVAIADTVDVNPVSLMAYENVVMTVDALRRIEEMYG